MKTEFATRFYKDIDKITQKFVKSDVSATIKQIEGAKKLSEVKTSKNSRGTLLLIEYVSEITGLAYSMRMI